IKNNTGRTIYRDTPGTIRLCDAKGCYEGSWDNIIPPRNPDTTKAYCGSLSYFVGARPGVVQSCVVTVDIPEPFEEKLRPDVKEYPRGRPPGPPQPGLLETKPGYSPQSP